MNKLLALVLSLALAGGLFAVDPAPLGSIATATLASDGSFKYLHIDAAGALVVNGNGATGAVPPAMANYLAGLATTANPANATAGNLTPLMLDKAGRVVVTPSNVRELVAVQQTSVATTGETTIVSAGGAGVFNDLAQLVITTAGAAAQTITIKDATSGTTRLVLNYPNAAVAPGAPLVINFATLLPQGAAAANWTVTQSVATACNYTVVFVKNL